MVQENSLREVQDIDEVGVAFRKCQFFKGGNYLLVCY